MIPKEVWIDVFCIELDRMAPGTLPVGICCFEYQTSRLSEDVVLINSNKCKRPLVKLEGWGPYPIALGERLG